MENQEHFEGQDVEHLMLELTPEQESEMLVHEFEDFAKSLEVSVPHIPAENTSVAEKVNNLCAALRSISKEEMLVLFNAMETAHPNPQFEEEDDE